jgi:hypothetical protein
MPEPTLSLHRKLAQIMFEAERVPKNGHAPAAMGGYAFVQVGDAADFIRKALAEHVLTMMPTELRVIQQVDRPTKAGGSMTTVDIVMDWTITDGESGESIVIQSFGAGADGGDKYSGKAQTNAMKYALLMGFLLSTGEDPELGHEETAGKPVTRANAATVARPVASAPQIVTDSFQPAEDIDDGFQSLIASNTAVLRPTQPVVGESCPKHDVPWRGEPGDLYHKMESGGYCRPEGQPRKTRWVIPSPSI